MEKYLTGYISALLLRCKEWMVEKIFPFYIIFVKRKQGVLWFSKTSSVVTIWFYKPQTREVGVWLPLYPNQRYHAEELFCSKLSWICSKFSLITTKPKLLVLQGLSVTDVNVLQSSVWGFIDKWTLRGYLSHKHTQMCICPYIYCSITRFSLVWPQWFLLSHRNPMSSQGSSYFHLCRGEIKIALARFKWQQAACQHRATKGDSALLGFVFSVFVLQPEVDQKEQKEHGDYVLDVLDGNNIEKF